MWSFACRRKGTLSMVAMEKSHKVREEKILSDPLGHVHAELSPAVSLIFISNTVACLLTGTQATSKIPSNWHKCLANGLGVPVA